MSQTSHLKIYNSGIFLLKDIYERLPKFSKQYKYLLGERIVDCLVEIIINITEVNNQKFTRKRVEGIDKILLKIDELFVYIRIAEELKQFNSVNAYPHLIEKINEIGKQATGWRKIYNPQNS